MVYIEALFLLLLKSTELLQKSSVFKQTFHIINCLIPTLHSPDVLILVCVCLHLWPGLGCEKDPRKV